MAKWTLEPGHTAAEFSVRHMMVTWVRGAFKNVHGEIEFDPEDPTRGSVEVEIDATGLWSLMVWDSDGIFDREALRGTAGEPTGN